MLLRIALKEQIADGIVRFDLRAPAGGDLPEFTPGAHAPIRTPSGLVRKYSLCGQADESDRYTIAVKREGESRGGSASMIEATQIGDLLEVGPPHNDFPLAHAPAGHIFVAGGIGVTPILSMIHHLRSVGDARFKLYYLTRSPQATAFREELSAPELRGKVEIHHDGGDPDRAFDLWPAFERPNGKHIYCCGPRALMESVRDMTGHWPTKAVHFETFGDAAAKRPDDVAFEVILARSGELLQVPADQSILQTVRAAGCAAPSSCESGSCGACKTELIAGEADHRDFVLSEAERSRCIMICVSRAKTPQLVLGL